MTPDMWNVTPDIWHMVGGEHSLKISALLLSRFGCNDIVKVWRKNDLINEKVTEVFVQQPRLHRVC